MSTLEQLLLKNISAEPKSIKTHFTVVNIPNRRGQARYRCLRCNHEFECSGRSRLIHHVAGVSPSGSQIKHVRACSNPYEPLRLALLADIRKKDIGRRFDFKSLLEKRKDPEDGEGDEYDADDLADGEVDGPQAVHTIHSDSDTSDLLNQPNPHLGSTIPTTSITMESPTEGVDFTDAPARKIRKVGRRPTYCVSGLARFPKEKLLSIVQTMHQIAPQIVQLSLMMEQASGNLPADLVYLPPSKADGQLSQLSTILGPLADSLASSYLGSTAANTNNVQPPPDAAHPPSPSSSSPAPPAPPRPTTSDIMEYFKLLPYPLNSTPISQQVLSGLPIVSNKNTQVLNYEQLCQAFTQPHNHLK